MPAPIQILAVAQAFKESLTVGAVRAAYQCAIRGAGGKPCVLLGSDGGDGLLDALQSQLTGRCTHPAVGPLGEPLDAEIGWLDSRTAVVESRLVCGLSLTDADKRSPLVTTTRGVGMLVEAAVRDGAATVYVGLGGSATMDGGLGMARAWGCVPRDGDGETLPEGGGALTELAALEGERRPAARIVGLADVANPLLGPGGAATYAPQKGATPPDTARLVRGLEQLVAVTDGAAPAALPGAGAAGGLGFGILRFAGGTLEPGAAWVLDRLGFDEALRQSALALVGEGAFDRTSLSGKLTGEVLRRAASVGVPAALVAPRAVGVPAGVTVETGPGTWSAGDLEAHAAAVIVRALRLPPP